MSFRPLSGNLIFQFFLVRKAIHFPPTHFRPLSGNLIFQLLLYLPPNRKEKCQFPSPIGESYFSIATKEFFRNLFTKKFPSPIGESYFSMEMHMSEAARLISFRPLSGNLIFQLYSPILCRKANSVSVPYRGILFFNI